MNSVVSEKGQVTIPKKLRDHLGLKPGVSIEFESIAGALVGKKTSTEEPLLAWVGKGKAPGDTKLGTTKAYLHHIRNRSES